MTTTETLTKHAATATDTTLEILEAIATAAIGAITGATQTTRALWVADRPRRRKIRTARRKKWWRRGKRNKWWRVALGIEYVFVGSWVCGRSALRVARATPKIATNSAQQARTGWTTGRQRHQARRAERTQREDIVDAEVLCDRCDTVLASDNPGPLCPTCRTQPTGDEAQASVHVAPQTAPTPTTPDPTILTDPAGAEPKPVGTHHLDGPPTARDQQFFDLRDAGYLGPILDGYPVSDMSDHPRRLTPQEVEAAISAGGYPPDSQPWETSPQPSQSGEPPTAATPEMSGGHPADDQQPTPGSTTKEITMPQPTTPAQGNLGGELTNIDALADEVTELTGHVEAASVAMDDIRKWARSLPERVIGADWQTGPVLDAATTIGEASTVSQIKDGITSLIDAAQKAKQLAAVMAAGGARGDMAGLQSQ